MFNIAILGARGLIGRSIIDVLYERNFPIKTLFPLSQHKQEMTIRDEVVQCHKAEEFDFSTVDLIFNATDKKVLMQYLPSIIESGKILIDKSETLRMDKDTPLVVAGVNDQHITTQNTTSTNDDNSIAKNASKIISSPNCVAIPLALIFNAFKGHAKLQDMFVTTFQSVSGAGGVGTKAMLEEAKKSFMSTNITAAYFDKRIAFDVLPKIGDFNQDLVSAEELKVMRELNKILNTKLDIHVTCTRVPVLIGHGIDLKIKCNLDAEKASKLLDKIDAIHVCDRDDAYITQRESVGEDKIFISRIRAKNGVLSMWVAYDNVRVGGSVNGVKIAEQLFGITSQNT